MSDQKYQINLYSILFHPELDKFNGYETIAYNWDNENIFKIDKNAYRILKIIDENPGITLKEIVIRLNPMITDGDYQQNKIQEFLDMMVKENIVHPV